MTKMELNIKPSPKSIVKYLLIVIVSVLALFGIGFITLIFSSVTGGTECKSKLIMVKMTLSKFDQAIEEYRIDLKYLPYKLSELYESNHPNWMGPYIKEKELFDPWGELYFYHRYPERNGYQLFTLGKDKKERGIKNAFDQLSEGSLALIEPTN